jgi:hypothetical protein
VDGFLLDFVVRVGFANVDGERCFDDIYRPNEQPSKPGDGHGDFGE